MGENEEIDIPFRDASDNLSVGESPLVTSKTDQINSRLDQITSVVTGDYVSSIDESKVEASILEAELEHSDNLPKSSKELIKKVWLELKKELKNNMLLEERVLDLQQKCDSMGDEIAYLRGQLEKLKKSFEEFSSEF